MPAVLRRRFSRVAWNRFTDRELRLWLLFDPRRYNSETGRDGYEDTMRDIWLILGAAWADTLPYREAFQSYANKRENFHFVPTISRESFVTDWVGETHYVQYILTKYPDDEAIDK